MKFSLDEIFEIAFWACAIGIATYVLYWFVVGFGTLAPGDFPWEDVFPWPLDEAFYYIAGSVEDIRDLFIGG